MNLDLNKIQPAPIEGSKFKTTSLHSLVLPSIKKSDLSLVKEQISNYSKLSFSALLPAVVVITTENIPLKFLKSIKETGSDFFLKTVKFFGLESLVEKAANLVKSTFQNIINLFKAKNLSVEDKKPETNPLSAPSNFALSATKTSSAEYCKKEGSNSRVFIGLDSFKKITEEQKNGEQALVQRLSKYSGKIIDQAEKAYLKLALTLNHFRSPELAKVEKLVAEADKS